MRKKLDLSLYLVLDPLLCGGINGMLETVAIAVQHGVTAVQLRAETGFSHKNWYITASALKNLLNNSAVPLIINDHIDVAIAVGADGVHIGQNDLPVHVVRQLIGSDKWLGLSISNQDELDQVAWHDVNYLGCGPVFPTTSKKNAAPALGCKQLGQLISQCRCPVVGIGGINLANVAAVMHSGTDGVAVVSAICGQANIQQVTTELSNKINYERNTRIKN